MKTTHFMALCGVGLLAATGCGEASDESTGDSDLAASTAMVGDFHLEARTHDEALTFEGAVTEISITKDGSSCHYEALQAAGGCDADHPCPTSDILSNEYSKKIAGECKMSRGVLTLEGDGGGLKLRF